jgi:zinc protease
VVGAVTVAEARQEILARFGGWPRPAGAPPRVAEAAPGPPPREEAVARDLTQSTIMLGRQAIRQTNPDYFPLVVASYVLGGGSASRLYVRVREEGGLAYTVYSYVSPSKYGSAFIVSAQTRTAEVPRVTAILREELLRMTRAPVTDAELSLAKSYLIGSFPLRLDTSGKVADFVGATEELGLGLDYADRYKERVGRVTAQDVLRVARKYFDPEAFNRVVVGKAP